MVIYLQNWLSNVLMTVVFWVSSLSRNSKKEVLLKGFQQADHIIDSYVDFDVLSSQIIFIPCVMLFCLNYNLNMIP